MNADKANLEVAGPSELVPPARPDGPRDGSAIAPGDLEAASHIWRSTDKPCIALVQRKLGIGYNYAAKLVALIKGE